MRQRIQDLIVILEKRLLDVGYPWVLFDYLYVPFVQQLIPFMMTLIPNRARRALLIPLITSFSLVAPCRPKM